MVIEPIYPSERAWKAYWKKNKVPATVMVHQKTRGTRSIAINAVTYYILGLPDDLTFSYTTDEIRLKRDGVVEVIQRDASGPSQRQTQIRLINIPGIPGITPGKYYLDRQEDEWFVFKRKEKDLDAV